MHSNLNPLIWASRARPSGVSVATQTDALPPPPRPPVLPPWMSARFADTDSEYDAASEKSENRVGRLRKTKASKGRPLISFSNKPMVPSFTITPGDVMENSVRWLIRHWNIPEPRKKDTCCRFHAASQCLSLFAKELLTNAPCNPAWQPFDGWRCSVCHLMHSNAEEDCDLCRTSRFQSSSEGSDPPIGDIATRDSDDWPSP